MKLFGPVLRRSIAGVVAAAAILCVYGQPAHAGSTTLWYNGNLDQRDALANQTGAPDGLVYDDFIVPTGMTYTITAVFSNDALAPGGTLGTTAYWEIRSGVSDGNGGTLLSSGDAADATTNTGLAFTFGGISSPVYTNQVSIPSITLAAGTYWLAVAPDTSNQSNFIVTTSGADAIGSPPGDDGNSFYSSTFFGFSFTPTTNPNIEGPGTWDYSMGVIGTAAVIPEPSSLILGAIGMVSAAGCVWNRRRSRA
jgi:hypothetical protein